MGTFFLGMLVFAGLASIWAAMTYNVLIRMKLRTDNAWSQIDVQLKRRHDLIPNLVETAKAYMGYENKTLQEVIKARTQATQAASVKDVASSENLITSSLRSLFAVVESYPDLKADQNMLRLQEELSSTENRISFARQNYNDETANYNTVVRSFPSNLIAVSFNFGQREFFEIEDTAHRETPKVAF